MSDYLITWSHRPRGGVRPAVNIPVVRNSVIIVPPVQWLAEAKASMPDDHVVLLWAMPITSEQAQTFGSKV